MIMQRNLLNFKFFFLFLLFLFSNTAFAAERILIIGDSLSANYGIETKQGWVNLLQLQLQKTGYRYEVINASISGDTTSNGLARLPSALKQFQPQIVIIELGGNDGLRGLQIKTIANNLGQMINLAQQHNAKVLLLGLRIPPHYGPVYTQQFQAMYLKLANDHHISLVPLFLSGVDNQEKLMQADGIHPATAAQTILLENVWQKLKALLKRDTHAR